jgi:mannosyltransferase OCH1-like enzyme
MNKFPKIIHQIWIGDKIGPTKHMDTWRDNNPTFEYIRWNEEEINKRNMIFDCQNKIDDMEEINGKADIMRWEILYKYGGFFQDADSICISPIDDNLIQYPAFVGFEHEQERPGLIATGTMAFPPKHPLVKNAINWIKNNDINRQRIKKRAWETVGPGLLTKIYNEKTYSDIKVLPSYYFLPIHCTGIEYHEHGKIYAFQEWGSTKENYDEISKINELNIPDSLLPIDLEISILVSSYNTKANYLKECLESIKNQTGNFKMEIIWINDGSNELNSKILKKLLDNFEKTTRFIRVCYYENETNMGVAYSLNKGINLCSNDIIMRMDSDDIMRDNRCITQIRYMIENPDVKMCGGQIIYKSNNNLNNKCTHHPSITWDDYIKNPKHWIANHATLCFRKHAIIEIGNYSLEYKDMVEDLNLEIRILKKYGYIHNLPFPLYYYRLHNNQVTCNNNDEWRKIRDNMIDKLINL